MTGSSTMLRAEWRSSASATAATLVARDSMPILTAAISRSSNSASIWAAMKSAGTSWMAPTLCVFCTVSAAMADTP